MENKLKVRLSRIFQTSFTSCRTKDTSDVVEQEQPFFFPENHHHHRQLIDLFSPKPQPFSSFNCKPRLSHSHSQTQNTHYNTYEKRPKISDRDSLLLSSSAIDNNGGQKCPPVSPITPTNNNNNVFYEKRPKKSRHRRTRSRKTNRKSETSEFFASITANYYGSSWYSSDEDDDDYDDETTLFSSRSLSSDSSESFRKHKARLADKKAAKTKREARNNTGNAAAGGVVTVEGSGRVTDSFAVVKKSSDPHNDFRTSMVEMIVEKQIFGAQELENLLQCFLTLNSDRHHRVIVEVFTEILEALFSNDSC